MKKKIILGFLFFLLTCASFAQVFPNAKYEVVNNKKLAYYEQGNGKETIILLHGWPQTSYVWRKVLPSLSNNYKVIAVDLPGLGNSETITDYSTENVSDILHQFFVQKNIQKVHLVGHDLGTWVALTYAIKYENSLSTLTLVDAGIPGLMNPNVFQPENANKIWQFYFHGISDLPELLVKGKEKEYFNWYFSTKSTIKEAISKSDEKVYLKAYMPKEKMKAGFDYYRAYQENATYNSSTISTISIPILAIGGEKALAENVGKAVQPYAKSIEIISLPNSGHYVPEEQPKLFVDTLLQFLHQK